MPNEWERMLISLALRLGWWWAGNQKCLCLFSELTPWRSLNHHLLSSHEVTTIDFCLWRVLKAGNLDMFSALQDSCLFSDWNWGAEGKLNHRLGEQTFPWPEGCIHPQGTTSKTPDCKKYYLSYLNGIKYELGMQKWTRGQAVANISRNRVLHSSSLSSLYLNPLVEHRLMVPTSWEHRETCYLRPMPYSLIANESRQASGCY